MLVFLTFTFPADELLNFASELLRKADTPEETARLTADSLVSSNLRGVDSHGLQLLPYYLGHIEAGNIRPRETGRVIVEAGACLLYDGGQAFGQVSAAICCDHAVRLAEEHGIAIVAERNSNHYGAAAYWGQRMARGGMIGITMCNASPSVAPWQGKDGRFGTNPICVCVPGERLWLLDMATTTVALGKILNAKYSGKTEIPQGWAMDREGVPTTSTETALEGLLMPLGGYKGSGLMMMVEILCGVLGGGAMSREVGGIRDRSRPMRTSHVYLAIDVARFLPLDEFEERMKRLIAEVKSSHPASGYDEVLVAGEPEWRIEDERRREGIPLSEGVWANLKEAARRLDVPTPVAAGG